MVYWIDGYGNPNIRYREINMYSNEGGNQYEETNDCNKKTISWYLIPDFESIQTKLLLLKSGAQYLEKFCLYIFT